MDSNDNCQASVLLNCGCKGVRTCLVCEKVKNKLSKPVDTNKSTVLYTYCPHCNLCWRTDDVINEVPSAPLYLGNITLILDFLNQDEEAEAIAAIDEIPWLPSQSGRKKQDFGPKVNFKKRKGKIGDFKGFPHFSKKFIHRFQQLKELSDFFPVELCHLDYSPDRGSAIDPHVDDSWIWGERLITVNLASSTILTLTPANTQSCNCSNIFDAHFTNSLLERTDVQTCSHTLSSFSSSTESCQQAQISSPLFSSLKNADCGRDICGSYRTAGKDVEAVVHVVLPPRSLLVLAGCARHNWFHEIRRGDITSRRVAMTFRELSTHFLIGETEKKLGEELLEIGRNFL